MRLLNFDYTRDRADCLYFQLIGASTDYKRLWSMLKSILILSHGQATVERGFSTMKQQYKDNLNENSFTSQRIVLDHIQYVGGARNVVISKPLLLDVAAARQRYDLSLKSKAKEKQDSDRARKRKAAQEEISGLERKKALLEADIESLSKKADDLSMKAEQATKLVHMKEYVVLCNSHKKTCVEKKKELVGLIQDIEVKTKQRNLCD